MNRCLYCYKEVENGKDFHKVCSKIFFGTENPPRIEYSLSEMTALAKQVIERSVSVPGVQPKLSMSLLESDTTDKRLTVIGALGGNYIFKPPSLEYKEMPANEHLTMKLAKLFAIDVVPNSLIRLASGELSYITKRIDRSEDGSKIHMIDMFQITEAFDKYRGSMERIGKAINLYAENTLLDKLRLFELTIFSYLTGNNDMHLKNFSMLKTSYGWALSPAYDLLNVTIIDTDDTEELALTITGKKKRIIKQNFIEFGMGMELTEKQILAVFKRFIKLFPKAEKILLNSFLSEELQLEYKKLLEQRIVLFF